MKTKKILSIILTLSLLCSFTISAIAAPPASTSNNQKEMTIPEKTVDSITIDFTESAKGESKQDSVTNMLNSKTVEAFFDVNEMDRDYYSNWILSHDINTIESVVFTVTEPVLKNSGTYADRSNYDYRLVYAEVLSVADFEVVTDLPPGELISDAVLETIELVLSFSGSDTFSVVTTLASVLGIVSPQTEFGSTLVRVGEDFYTTFGQDRLVTKFIELYAPVSGSTRWYPWALAESNYVRFETAFYHRLEEYDSGLEYHQYYTQRYYYPAGLVEKAYAAYPNYLYQEVATEYAAHLGGYTLFDRAITSTQFQEYSDLFQ